MENEKQQPLQITVKRQYRPEFSEVAFINFVRFVYSGTDVVMDVGVIDPDRIHALVLEPTLQPEADALISRRYGMSLNTFAMLKRHLDEIWEKIDTTKALDPTLKR